MRKIGTVLAASWAMAGCTGGSPSQAEIETAVMNAFTGSQREQCEKIAIDNIRKTNGIKIDDSTYQIIATYDVRIVPVGHKEEVDGLQSERARLGQERLSASNEIRRIKSDNNITYEDVWMERNSGEVADQIRFLLQKEKELGNRWGEVQRELEQKIKTVRNEWGSDYCYMIIGSGFGTGQFGFKDSLEAITTGGTNTFERTFNMVRTDNGWMELK